MLLGGSAATFASVFAFTGSPKAQAIAKTVAAKAVYYPGCDAVRALGKAPLYRGQPGYRPEMDGDDDGIACEPYRGGSGGGYRSRKRRRG
ncbi:MAG: excalibur calcium-binding domain-containing protein [Rhizorhabdus sp.]